MSDLDQQPSEHGVDWDDSWENSDWRHSMDWAGSQSWIWGTALLLFGFVLLLNNFGLTRIYLHNWWAIFILIPGINMLAHAFSRYRDTGQVTPMGRRSGLWGVVLVAIALVFFFDLSWSLAGPLLLVLAGGYLLLARR